MSRINEIILDEFQSYAIIDIKWSAQMNQYQKTTEKKKQAIIQAALSLFKINRKNKCNIYLNSSSRASQAVL